MNNFINRNVGKIIVIVALTVVEVVQAVMDAGGKGRRKK